MIRIDSSAQDWYNQTVEFAKKIGLYEPLLPDPEVDQQWHFPGVCGGRVLNVDRSKNLVEVKLGWRSTPQEEVVAKDSLAARDHVGTKAVTWDDFKRNWKPFYWHVDERKGYLKKSLDYLETWGEGEGEKRDRGRGRCDLFKDFSPASFAFNLYLRGEDGAYRFVMNGGLLYHGAHDAFGSGQSPTYAEPTDGWSIHT